MLTVQNILDFLSGASDLTGAFVAIVGGVCALKGISYIESLRQKKANSTFSFESQLYVRLCDLKHLLDKNDKLLTYMFNEVAKTNWSDKRGATDSELAEFFNCAKEILEFIKTAEDQMPVCDTWTRDYYELIRFLVDVIRYDVKNSAQGFKYTEICDMSLRSSLHRSICDVVERLILAIEQDQLDASQTIFAATTDDGQ